MTFPDDMDGMMPFILEARDRGITVFQLLDEKGLLTWGTDDDEPYDPFD